MLAALCEAVAATPKKTEKVALVAAYLHAREPGGGGGFSRLPPGRVFAAVEWGHGKRARVLSDYTFAVRDGDRLLYMGKDLLRSDRQGNRSGDGVVPGAYGARPRLDPRS